MARVEESKSARHYPGANVAAVVTLVATSRMNQARRVIWSYSGAPTNGMVTIEDGSGNIIRKWYITAGGPGSIPVSAFAAISNNLIITLSAGGIGISGTLDVEYGVPVY